MLYVSSWILCILQKKGKNRWLGSVSLRRGFEGWNFRRDCEPKNVLQQVLIASTGVGARVMWHGCALCCVCIALSVSAMGLWGSMIQPGNWQTSGDVKSWYPCRQHRLVFELRNTSTMSPSKVPSYNQNYNIEEQNGSGIWNHSHFKDDTASTYTIRGYIITEKN